MFVPLRLSFYFTLTTIRWWWFTQLITIWWCSLFQNQLIIELISNSFSLLQISGKRVNTKLTQSLPKFFYVFQCRFFPFCHFLSQLLSGFKFYIRRCRLFFVFIEKWIFKLVDATLASIVCSVVKQCGMFGCFYDFICFF